MVVVLTFADWHSHSDMEKKVIRSASFYRAAKENYVLVYIDRNSKGAKRDEVEQSGELREDLPPLGGVFFDGKGAKGFPVAAVGKLLDPREVG